MMSWAMRMPWRMGVLLDQERSQGRRREDFMRGGEKSGGSGLGALVGPPGALRMI
jgi:hypothetical protein